MLIGFITPSTALEEGEMIQSLILVDEGANGALDLLEQLTGKSILRQQDLPKVKITYNSKGPISRKNAILAVESSLGMNGVAVTQISENFWKAVPAVGVKGQSPTLIKGSTLDLDPNQNFYTKVFTLKYLSPKDARTIAQNVQTKNVGSVLLLDSSNAIMMTDSLVNLQRVETLFKEVDKPLALHDSLNFFPMRYANASEVKKKLDVLKRTDMKKYLQSAVFEADEGTNQLLVMAHPDSMGVITRLLKNMDVDVAPLNRSEVFRIKHAQAKEVAALIKSVVKGKPRESKKSGSDNRDALLERLKALTNKSGEGAVSGSQTQEFSASLTVEPDERSNAVVAFGTPRDLELVKDLISELDVVLPQVQIEVIIAQVDLSGDQVSGLSSFGINRNNTAFGGTDAAKNQKWELAKLAATATTALSTPLTLSGTLKDFAMSTVFSLAQKDENIEILSAPMIMTTHNREAEIKVVTDQPIVKESVTNTDNNSALRTTTEFIKDIGIVLTVTPLIGDDGVIEMDIKQTVKELAGEVDVTSSQKVKAVNNREARSFVSVRDGETIVLGGLQKRSDDFTKGKVFFFGYIPVIGDLLFSPKTKISKVSELVIFVRPHIVRTSADASERLEDAMDSLSVREDVDYYFENGDFGQSLHCAWLDKKKERDCCK